MENIRQLEARLDPDAAPTSHPWRVAMRNSAVAVCLLAAAGLLHVVRYRGLVENTAWWVWPTVGAVAVSVCFGHAALGLVVGRRTAANIFKVVLLLLLVAIVLWLKQELR